VKHAQRTTPRWALILGASSGFGGATATALSKAGYDIAGVHLDRAAGLVQVRKLIAGIKARGRRAMFFNANAADEKKRAEVLDALAKDVGDNGGTVAVLMHSLAFGTLKPFIGSDVVSHRNMNMTLEVMAHSLVFWMQDIMARGLMGRGGRVISMTSSGSNRVIPQYGAVSAAKCALESHTRQLAVELAAHGITVNAIRGGVTRTPASERIPDSDQLFVAAVHRNPHRRLTVPKDVAQAIAALCKPGTDWLTGNVINVDGGEEVAG